MMVNNSTNTNKMHDHLSPEIIKHKRPWHLPIQILPWDRHKNMTGLNWYIGFQHFPYRTRTTECQNLEISYSCLHWNLSELYEPSHQRFCVWNKQVFRFDWLNLQRFQKWDLIFLLKFRLPRNLAYWKFGLDRSL